MSTVSAPDGPAAFTLPPELEASEPPEARGLPRDAVRLLVARGHDARGHGARGHDARLEHRWFNDLPALLDPGDVLVVNTSATLPAALEAVTGTGERAVLHYSGQLPGGLTVVELRHRGVGAATASGPWLDASAGTVVHLPAGGSAELRMPAVATRPVRLWVASLDLPEPLLVYLAGHGRPIRYGYVPRPWPIGTYQTVFADVPGSAEMPSAGRPFSAEVVTRLVAKGVVIAPFVLHCGVASPESHEPPLAEWYRVPASTAQLVNAARASGARVVAVGTTAVRALETVTDGGTIPVTHPGQGWTEVVIGPDRPVRSVDGLVTGWHEPGASHLALLEAVAGRDLVDASYREALSDGYLWHEFGDSHLVLP